MAHLSTIDEPIIHYGSLWFAMVHYGSITHCRRRHFSDFPSPSPSQDNSAPNSSARFRCCCACASLLSSCLLLGLLTNWVINQHDCFHSVIDNQTSSKQNWMTDDDGHFPQKSLIYWCNWLNWVNECQWIVAILFGGLTRSGCVGLIVVMIVVITQQLRLRRMLSQKGPRNE